MEREKTYKLDKHLLKKEIKDFIKYTCSSYLHFLYAAAGEFLVQT